MKFPTRNTIPEDDPFTRFVLLAQHLVADAIMDEDREHYLEHRTGECSCTAGRSNIIEAVLARPAISGFVYADRFGGRFAMSA